MVMAHCANFKIQGNTIDLAKGVSSCFFLENDGYFLVTGNTFTATNPKARIATARDTKTLFGKFIFLANTSSTTGGINLSRRSCRKTNQPPDA